MKDTHCNTREEVNGRGQRTWEEGQKIPEPMELYPKTKINFKINKNKNVYTEGEREKNS